MRGDVHQLARPRDRVGHEQDGARFAVVVQSSDMMLSTVLICPTSVSAQPAVWRPEITVQDKQTKVITEQLMAVDPSRLGRVVGFLPLADMLEIDRALRLVLGLR